MVWNLEDNSDDPKEVRIYRYLKNKKLAKTIVKFLNLYAYLKKQKYRDAEELRQDILKNGEPLFSQKESEELFRLNVMRGGESKYPVLNNFLKQFLGWVYKWQPAVLADITDTLTPIKDNLQIFKNIRENYELGEIYGVILDTITEIIPANVTVLENVASEIPVVGTVSGLIATMISSVFIVFNNMLHFAQGDDAGVFVDSFLMIPFIGTSLHSAALATERSLGGIVEKRQKLIDTVQKAFGPEHAIAISSYIPDLSQVPTSTPPANLVPDTNLTNLVPDTSLTNLVPGAANLIQNPSISNLTNLVPGAANLTNLVPDINLTNAIPSITNLPPNLNPLKQLTGGKHTKRKWTLKKSRV
jgi:hypothetical protein